MQVKVFRRLPNLNDPLSSDFNIIELKSPGCNGLNARPRRSQRSARAWCYQKGFRQPFVYIFRDVDKCKMLTESGRFKSLWRYGCAKCFFGTPRLVGVSILVGYSKSLRLFKRPRTSQGCKRTVGRVEESLIRFEDQRLPFHHPSVKVKIFFYLAWYVGRKRSRQIDMQNACRWQPGGSP